MCCLTQFYGESNNELLEEFFGNFHSIKKWNSNFDYCDKKHELVKILSASNSMKYGIDTSNNMTSSKTLRKNNRTVFFGPNNIFSMDTRSILDLHNITLLITGKLKIEPNCTINIGDRANNTDNVTSNLIINSNIVDLKDITINLNNSNSHLEILGNDIRISNCKFNIFDNRATLYIQNRSMMRIFKELDGIINCSLLNSTVYFANNNNKIYNSSRHNCKKLYFTNCTIKHSCDSDIRIAKYNTFVLNNTDVDINNSKIDCPGSININMYKSKIVINVDTDNLINLLPDGTNNIKLVDSLIMINNNSQKGAINFFGNINTLPRIKLENSTLILNNIILNINDGYIHIKDNSKLEFNHSKLNFNAGMIKVNNSSCTFNNNSSVDLNKGIFKIINYNSKFYLNNSQMISDKPECMFIVWPGNNITLDNSEINCLGKFKKIQKVINIYTNPQNTEFNLNRNNKINKNKYKLNKTNTNKRSSSSSSSLSSSSSSDNWNKKDNIQNIQNFNNKSYIDKNQIRVSNKKAAKKHHNKHNNNDFVTDEIENNRMLHIKNNSVFQWDKLRCDQYDLTDIDNTSMVIVNDYFD